ncbi:hypothetical protein HDK77DRAFT_256735 [Phyllosticta capitalensis]
MNTKAQKGHRPFFCEQGSQSGHFPFLRSSVSMTDQTNMAPFLILPSHAEEVGCSGGRPPRADGVTRRRLPCLWIGDDAGGWWFVFPGALLFCFLSRCHGGTHRTDLQHFCLPTCLHACLPASPASGSLTAASMLAAVSHSTASLVSRSRQPPSLSSRDGPKTKVLDISQHSHTRASSLPLPFPSRSTPSNILHGLLCSSIDMLPPLAILIPRIIRVLELLVELYGIFAPCVGCAIRGCFGGCFGCGRNDKKKPDDGCDCPPKEQERKRLCFSRKREGRVKEHSHSCVYNKKEEERNKRHWWQFEKSSGKGRKLHKSPPRGLDLEDRGGREEDAELQVLQRQYSSLPQPPTPPPAVAAVVA